MAPGRHEEAAQHQILDVEPADLQVGMSFQAMSSAILLVVGELLAVEHAERPQLAGPPLRDRLDRVVDAGIDVVADQLHRDLAAALVGDVGELRAGRLLDRDGDDLVFLLGAGAAHLELAVRRLP